MSTCHQQAQIDAPVEVVWELVGDPKRYPEWAGHVAEVTGLPTVEKGGQFEQVTRLPLGAKTTTSFQIDDLDDELRRIRMHCTKSGFFSQWRLTEAAGGTFAEAEFGMVPERLRHRAMDAAMSRGAYQRMLRESFDGLRALAERERTPADA